MQLLSFNVLLVKPCEPLLFPFPQKFQRSIVSGYSSIQELKVFPLLGLDVIPPTLNASTWYAPRTIVPSLGHRGVLLLRRRTRFTHSLPESRQPSFRSSSRAAGRPVGDAANKLKAVSVPT